MRSKSVDVDAVDIALKEGVAREKTRDAERRRAMVTIVVWISTKDFDVL
jgi:hypothetical protein